MHRFAIRTKRHPCTDRTTDSFCRHVCLAFVPKTRETWQIGLKSSAKSCERPAHRFQLPCRRGSDDDLSFARNRNDVQRNFFRRGRPTCARTARDRSYHAPPVCILAGGVTHPVKRPRVSHRIPPVSPIYPHKKATDGRRKMGALRAHAPSAQASRAAPGQALDC